MSKHKRAMNIAAMQTVTPINTVACETAGQILVVPEQNARALPLRMLQDDDARSCTASDDDAVRNAKRSTEHQCIGLS